MMPEAMGNPEGTLHRRMTWASTESEHLDTDGVSSVAWSSFPNLHKKPTAGERNSLSHTAFAARSLWLACDLLDLPQETALPFLTPLPPEQHSRFDYCLQAVLALVLGMVTPTSPLCILSLTLTPSESCPGPPFISQVSVLQSTTAR